MAEIRSRDGLGRSTARKGQQTVRTPTRQQPSIIPTTQWQRYLDRLRRLVRLSVHP